MKRYVAFLDALGFATHVGENLEGAMNILVDANMVIKTRLFDASKKDHPETIKYLAKRHSVEAFESYLPLSDSIFIVGRDANDFIEQLSSFLCDCFHSNLHLYTHPDDKDNPTKYVQTVYKIGSQDVAVREARAFPTIFRGGIAYGDVAYVDAISIFRNEDILSSQEKGFLKGFGSKTGIGTTLNIAGNAVVNAVMLEQCGGKGPKLYIDENTYQALSDYNKKFVLIDKVFDKENNHTYEVKHFLWTAYFPIVSNGIDIGWNECSNLLRGVLNLLNMYAEKPDLATQYSEFANIVIQGFIKAFENDAGKMKINIEQLLAENGIDSSQFSI